MPCETRSVADQAACNPAVVSDTLPGLPAHCVSHCLSLHLSSAEEDMEEKGESSVAQQQQRQQETHQAKQAERKGHCVTCHQHTPKGAGESGEG